jgi:hypothetical protein
MGVSSQSLHVHSKYYARASTFEFSAGTLGTSITLLGFICNCTEVNIHTNITETIIAPPCFEADGSYTSYVFVSVTKHRIFKILITNQKNFAPKQLAWFRHPAEEIPGVPADDDVFDRPGNVRSIPWDGQPRDTYEPDLTWARQLGKTSGVVNEEEAPFDRPAVMLDRFLGTDKRELSRQLRSHRKVSGAASQTKESQVFPTKRSRSTNQVNSTRFLTRNNQKKVAPMTNLRTGLVSQVV